MNNTPPPRSVLVEYGVQADTFDPWGEFPSESSEEFQAEGAPPDPPFASEADLEQTPAAPAEDRPLAGAAISRVDQLTPAGEEEEPAALAESWPEAAPSTALVARGVTRPEPASDASFVSASTPHADPGPVEELHERPATAPLADAPERPASAPPPAPTEAIARTGGSPSDAGPSGAASPGPATSAPAAALADQALSLADVIARQTPVHESEAVAVVQELCATLQNRRGNGLIPELAGVLITPEGGLLVKSQAKGDRDVRSLGRILHNLLSTGTAPLPLRLFVTSVTSSNRYRSVELFADALSHYGAADRTGLIRSLYHRARALPRAPIRPARATRPDAAAPVPAKPRPAVRALALAAATGAILTAGVGIWLWRSAPMPMSASSDAMAAVVRAIGTLGEGGTANSPPARDPWQLGSLSVPPSEPPARTAARRAPSPQQSAARPGVSGAAAPVSAAPPPPPAAASPPPPPPSSRNTVAAPVPAQITSVAAVPAGGVTIVDPTVYSRSDGDVQPPTLLSSQMPEPAAPTPNDSRASNVLELLVDERGRVQNVRLVNRPMRMPDIMMLSGAKMLKFSPALRNGTPVKYRVQMRWTATPG